MLPQSSSGERWTSSSPALSHSRDSIPHKGDKPPDTQQHMLMLLSGSSARQCVHLKCSPREVFVPSQGLPFSLPPFFLSPSCHLLNCPHGTVLCSEKQGGEGGRACSTEAGRISQRLLPQGSSQGGRAGGSCSSLSLAASVSLPALAP